MAAATANLFLRVQNLTPSSSHVGRAPNPLLLVKCLVKQGRE